MTQSNSLEIQILSDFEEVVFSIGYPKLDILYTSPSIKTLTGYDSSFFLKNKQSWQNIVFNEDRNLLKHALTSLTKTQKFRLRFRIETKDQNIKYIECRGRLVQNPTDQSYRIDGIVSDISDLLPLQSLFRDESLDFKHLLIENNMIFNGSQDSMFLIEVMDLGDFVIRRINQAYEKSTGITQTMVQGKTPLQLLGEELGTVVVNNFKKAIDAKKTISYEESFPMPAGTKVWITELTPIEIEGKFKYIVGASKDITEQKAAENALKEYNERYSLILEASSDGWFDWDLINNTVIYSRRWWLEFGNDEKPENVPIGYWKSLIHPDDAEWVSEFLENILASQRETFEFTFQMKKRKGNYAHVLSKCYIQSDNAGNKIRMLGSNTDLTETKKMEYTLRHAKELAEAANIAKGNFLANMSHEIRTPLNGIIGFTELLLNSPLQEEQKEYLKNISLSGKSLLELVNQILDFSKIDSGKFELEYVNTNLKDLVVSTLNLFQVSASAKGIRLELFLDPKLPNFVSLDPLRIRQILSNLIGNAVKFTHEGSVKISIHRLDQKEKMVTISFEVEDTGIGIDTKVRSKLFDSFSQADTSITRKYGGTGLGLTITNELLLKMHSKLNIESELGVGSRFSFILKLDIKSSGESISSIFDDQPSHVIESDFVKIPGFQHEILIVEDNDLNRKLLAKLLHKKYPNTKLRFAIDGVEALAQFQSKKPDLIIMDLQMPIMDGYTATIEIRKLEPNPNKKTPIVALTAGAYYSVKDSALESGMDDFLTKPISATNLYETVEKWLSSSRM
ncbi:PAS domain S-box protein [Leptospira yanagawae serovar Saopaulo str. Sao Paulo = ATCC 700523]|uniref:histidine kinase n=1 Tax=Leptospira yanagawae serovar Saopaulo str. Sao Paulo = ATCC 700523 TaxID=1249483 RepID=A0A5E8HFW1_9LEPT|nr:ATP-binding protein [Leptospira yanagawae]EOQ90139.1 PAS domain S-box protein [Leptospira yanagawae serovar Saopaulo str. Sao Paulo = ATCC 700523]